MADALEGLVEMAGQARHFRLGVARHLAHALADARDGQDRGREGEEGGQRQRPVLIEHDADQRQQRQQILAEPGQRLADRHMQQGDIVHHPADERAAGSGVEEGEVGVQQMREKAFAHIGDDALGHAFHHHLLAEIGQPLHHEGGEHEAGDEDELVAVLGGEHLVQHRLHQLCQGGGRAGDQHHQHQRQGKARRIALHMLAQQPPDQCLGGRVENLLQRCAGNQRHRVCDASAAPSMLLAV